MTRKPTPDELSKLSQMYNDRRKVILHYRSKKAIIAKEQKPMYDALIKEKKAFLASDKSLLVFLDKQILDFRLKIGTPPNYWDEYRRRWK